MTAVGALHDGRVKEKNSGSSCSVVGLICGAQVAHAPEEIDDGALTLQSGSNLW